MAEIVAYLYISVFSVDDIARISFEKRKFKIFAMLLRGATASLKLEPHLQP